MDALFEKLRAAAPAARGDRHSDTVVQVMLRLTSQRPLRRSCAISGARMPIVASVTSLSLTNTPRQGPTQNSDDGVLLLPA